MTSTLFQKILVQCAPRKIAYITHAYPVFFGVRIALKSFEIEHQPRKKDFTKKMVEKYASDDQWI